MPIDVMVKEATGLPDKYVDMVVSYIHFLQYQLKSEDDYVRSSGKRELQKAGIVLLHLIYCKR